MPRNYVKKRVSSYSDTDLELAILDVKKGKTILAAARQYAIPFETLRRWITCPPSHKKSGRSTILTPEEEICIVQALEFLAKCGYPLDRQDVINIAQQYIKSCKDTKCESLGVEWARGFEKRWANRLAKRKPELLTKARANDLSFEVVNCFFDMYSNLLSQNNLENAPDRIFNLDEVGLGTDFRASKVFVHKKDRNAYLKSPDAGKAMYTVLFCVSATGNFLPPLTVYKSLNMYESWTKGGPHGALYAYTESGWMHDTVFESWMSSFVEHVKHLEKPVLLIFDGHGSHLTYTTVKKAIDNEIIILCLPPNTSHALQPLDVGVFAPMKQSWKKFLKLWYRETRLQKVTKASFPHLLKQLFETLKGENAVKGFKGAGLYPVDKKAVEHRIIFTEKNTYEEVANAMQPSTSSTGMTAHIYAETENKFLDSHDKHSMVSSPYKDLKSAILTAISPSQSYGTKNALENARRKRKRVQSKAGEILTQNEVAQRLLQEEIDRLEKKKNVKPQPSKIRKKDLPNKKKTSPPFAITHPTCTTSDRMNASEILPGKWVKVKYAKKNSVVEFNGQIIGMEEGGEEFNVKFLTKSTIGDFFIFPEQDDTDVVTKSQIVKILKEPHFNNRGHYRFQI